MKRITEQIEAKELYQTECEHSITFYGEHWFNNNSLELEARCEICDAKFKGVLFRR